MSYNNLYCEHSPIYHRIDWHEGTIVCTECGSVIDEGVSVMSEITLPVQGELQINDKVKEIMLDLSANGNIAKDIEQTAFEVFEAINKKLCNFKTQEKAAFAIYQACKKHGVARTVQEVTGFSGVPSKILFKMEGIIGHIVDIKPSGIADRVGGCLGLGFKDLKKIKEKADKVYREQGHHSPQSILGATILNFCQENNIRIKPVDICNTLGISNSSLIRTKKKILKK